MTLFSSCCNSDESAVVEKTHTMPQSNKDLAKDLQAAKKIELSAEAKAALAEHGWNKGAVAFGFDASEATAKLAVGLPIAGIDAKWVTISFDDSKLEDIPEDFDPNFITPGSTQKMGVKSELYHTITGGAASMPALAIDGDMYLGSDAILKKLALESNAPKTVTDLIDHSISHSDIVFEGLKHWGWCAMHAYQNYAMVNKDHYISYGAGNKDEAWEKNVTDTIKSLMNKLEDTLAKKKEINGFYVGDSLTLADASVMNWVQSLEGVTGLDIKKHYPKCYANWEKFKEISPAGSQHFIYGFPVFCGYVAQANEQLRKEGFDINKYWEE